VQLCSCARLCLPCTASCLCVPSHCTALPRNAFRYVVVPRVGLCAIAVTAVVPTAGAEAAAAAAASAGAAAALHPPASPGSTVEVRVSEPLLSAHWAECSVADALGCHHQGGRATNPALRGWRLTPVRGLACHASHVVDHHSIYMIASRVLLRVLCCWFVSG
jgi:hypothetical protein